MVNIDQLKDHFYLLLSKRRVKLFQNFLELVDCQVAASVGIVGVESLVESEVFGCEDPVQFYKALFGFLVQGTRQLASSLLDLGCFFSLLDETYPIFLHLFGQLFQGDGAICVGVHFFKEKGYFLFVYFGVDLSEEL